MNWNQFEQGKTIGQIGSETGEILLEDEHKLGARITLEKVEMLSKRYFTITCGIYGWMMHTCFLANNKELAVKVYQEMRIELDRILELIPTVEEADDENMSKVSDEISKFVEEFS